jgi:hypothetical protein
MFSDPLTRLPLFGATCDLMAMKRCVWAGDDPLMRPYLDHSAMAADLYDLFARFAGSALNCRRV